MKAGRELDALVAEKVMGWQDITDEHWGVPPGAMGDSWAASPFEPAPPYSTDITAAWQIMDYMLEQNDQQLFLRFAHAVRSAPEGDLVAHVHTAARRICLAALRAVGAL